MVVKKVKNKEYCNRYSILHRVFSGVRQAFLRCSHIHAVTYRQTTDIVYDIIDAKQLCY